MTRRPLIVQHCFGTPGLGGPMSGVQRLLTSSLARTYHFETCFQSRPAGGINLPLIYEMSRQIRALRPDLLHVRGLQNEGFHGVVAGRLAGCRRILVSVHGLIGDVQAPASRWRQRIVSDFLEPYTLRQADGVYCVCAYAASRDIVVRHARRNFGHIHNAVPALEPLKESSLLRQSYGIEEQDVLAVYVGRLSCEKGLHDLFDALKLLPDLGTHRFKLLLVGDGRERSTLEQRSREYTPGQIIFAGQRQDVAELLAISDFLVLPSWHENLPNVLLEAMYAARAVIATRVGGCAEVVLDGETGLLVPPSAPADLAQAIHDLASDRDRRRQYGLAGRARIEAHFLMPRLVRQLDRVYQEMLGR
jgi:glycosyltransferase involved in cell wall biosynthesis